jgi:hypothetical protein
LQPGSQNREGAVETTNVFTPLKTTAIDPMTTMTTATSTITMQVVALAATTAAMENAERREDAAVCAASCRTCLTSILEVPENQVTCCLVVGARSQVARHAQDQLAAIVPVYV